MLERVTGDIAPSGPGVPPDLGIEASPISQRLQVVGGKILASLKLHEVEEGTFSSCNDDIPNLAERLLRARDTRIPLIEVQVLPDLPNYTTLQQIFATNSRLVLGILSADGVERTDSFKGKSLGYQNLTLSIPGHHEISLDGTYGSEITSALATGDYSGYEHDPTTVIGRIAAEQGRQETPNFGCSYTYERDPFCSSSIARMTGFLDDVEANFPIAAKRDGIIDVRVVPQVPELES